jgi:hypothetical protein
MGQEAMSRLVVAQICNLLYPPNCIRLDTREFQTLPNFGGLADCKSAIRQIANLRYISLVT